MYENKIEKCTLLFKRVTFDFKKKLDKEKEKRKGRVAKGSFGLTFNGVRDNKDGTKKKNLILKEKKKGNNNPPKLYNLQKTRV